MKMSLSSLDMGIVGSGIVAGIAWNIEHSWARSIAKICGAACILGCLAKACLLYKRAEAKSDLLLEPPCTRGILAEIPDDPICDILQQEEGNELSRLYVSVFSPLHGIGRETTLGGRSQELETPPHEISPTEEPRPPSEETPRVGSSLFSEGSAERKGLSTPGRTPGSVKKHIERIRNNSSNNNPSSLHRGYLKK